MTTLFGDFLEPLLVDVEWSTNPLEIHRSTKSFLLNLETLVKFPRSFHEIILPFRHLINNRSWHHTPIYVCFPFPNIKENKEFTRRQNWCRDQHGSPGERQTPTPVTPGLASRGSDVGELATDTVTPTRSPTVRYEGSWLEGVVVLTPRQASVQRLPTQSVSTPQYPCHHPGFTGTVPDLKNPRTGSTSYLDPQTSKNW